MPVRLLQASDGRNRLARPSLPHLLIIHGTHDYVVLATEGRWLQDHCTAHGIASKYLEVDDGHDIAYTLEFHVYTGWCIHLLSER